MLVAALAVGHGFEIGVLATGASRGSGFALFLRLLSRRQILAIAGCKAKKRDLIPAADHCGGRTNVQRRNPIASEAA
jgi:NAD(P)-dependent dehydrogenase (short-subunit alcohol dehydrogenase family)